MADFVDKNREEFDQNILDNANMYSCCVFRGKGQYTTAYFLTLPEAKACKARVLSGDAHARVLIYAMVVDGDTPDRIQQTMVTDA